MTNYTRVWRINGQLVVAYNIEDAIALYKKHYNKFDVRTNITEINLVFGDNSDLAIISDEDKK